MTCKNIRSARALTQPEINPVKQLNWVHEVPGKQLHVYTCHALSTSTLWTWRQQAQAGVQCKCTCTWKITCIVFVSTDTCTKILKAYKSVRIVSTHFHLSKTPM